MGGVWKASLFAEHQGINTADFTAPALHYGLTTNLRTTLEQFLKGSRYGQFMPGLPVIYCPLLRDSPAFRLQLPPKFGKNTWEIGKEPPGNPPALSASSTSSWPSRHSLGHACLLRPPESHRLHLSHLGPVAIALATPQNSKRSTSPAKPGLHFHGRCRGMSEPPGIAPHHPTPSQNRSNRGTTFGDDTAVPASKLSTTCVSNLGISRL
jgi:hypothetical protein